MRREINRPLIMWPSLATATMIAVMWLANHENPFMSEWRNQSSTDIFRSNSTFWTPEETQEAIQKLEASLHRSWDKGDTLGPHDLALVVPASIEIADIPLPSLEEDDLQIVLDIEPSDRTESGTRGVQTPPRIAEAFGLEAPGNAQSTSGVTAPTLNVDQELAGMSSLPVIGHEKSSLSNSVLSIEELFAISPLGESQCLESTSSPTTELIDDESSILHLFQVAQDGLARSLLDANGNPPALEMATQNLSAVDHAPESAATSSAIPESVRDLARLPSTTLEELNQLHTTDSDATFAPAASDVTGETVHVGDDHEFDRRLTVDRPVGWPIAVELNRQLERLSSWTPSRNTYFVSNPVGVDPSGETVSQIRDWSSVVSDLLKQLRSLDRIGHAAADGLLMQLREQVQEGRAAAEQVSDRESQIAWLRAIHGLDRRLAIWRPVWNISSGTVQSIAHQDPISDDAVRQAVAEVRKELVGADDESGWVQFLMLDAIESATNHPEANERMLVAQRLLSRFSWHSLTDAQRHWMARESIALLAESIRPWASGAVDYSRLVSQLERQEANAVDLASIEIADTVQSLRFTPSPEANRLASALDSNYRNANVRFAVAGEFIQRLLPEVQPQVVPLRTRMFGSDVHGYSNIASSLQLRLLPANDCWRMELQTIGNVNTQSVGHKSSVAVSTTGRSVFNAATPIEITPKQVVVNNTRVDVESNNQLRGVRTEYDGWPLIGSLVRGIAVSEYQEKQREAERRTNQQVRSQVANEVDTRVDEQMRFASKKFGALILGPLGQLQLEPVVVDMSSTSERLLARYRVAGDWQLAAFTPRPRAPRSSLVSLQMHQSAINNTLEQLVPRDQPQSISDVVAQSAGLFGVNLENMNDIPNDVMIQFAPTRPVTMEIEDGMVWLTMRVMRLTRNNSLDLRRFIVRAGYVPQIDGMKAELVRDAHLRISGPDLSMRERLPVRAIFNKVLSSERPIPLVASQMTEHPATTDLTISQLELRDGWLALAISKSSDTRETSVTPRVATRKDDTQRE
jgi:hypothetical protein